MDRPDPVTAAAEAAVVESPPADDPMWHRDAVIYQLHVKTFLDSNDDGIGDFAGLASRLDYIRDLGVNAIWLQPFYPSPLKDDGYDVSDYHDVHPHYGTLDDFRLFMRETQKRGLKVITELIVNHTSDQHPWFKAARQAPAGSPERDFYVWGDSPDRYRGTRIIFTDTESSNWAWDKTANAYYWHRFFSHQPDLNFDNPRVLEAIQQTMRYWLDMGVDGFRLDAVPYLCEREGTNNENLPETHAVIRQFRAHLDANYRNRILLAEANQWPEDVREYFSEGDECHMAYHFPLMPRIYMAIAQEDRHPVVDIMQQTPDIPEICQWAIFLRNHDELTLEMVTDKERDYMYKMYAADPRARINLGIRRRLAPLMENDPDRIKLMNSMLLSMPGSPIIYYGDEIGMGDNIYLGDRDGVRTPMQWSPDRNAGFSRADPQRLYLPPIMDPIYGHQAVNVEAQSRDPSSQLNWMKRILAVRKTSLALGRGKLSFLRPGNRKILAYLREYGDEAILCVVNLARSAQPVELNLARFKGRVPVEMLGRVSFPPIGELPYLLTLSAHGFYWFRLATDVAVPHWHEERLTRDDVPVLVLFDGWLSFFRDRVVPWRIGMAEKVRAQLETQVLPAYVEAQRWYAGKGEKLARARLADHVLWQTEAGSWMLALLEPEGASDRVMYFLPLVLAWENADEERMRGLAPATLAKVRQQSKVGVLAEAYFDEAFCRAVAQAVGAGLEISGAAGRVRFTPTRAYAEIVDVDIAALPIRRPQAVSSNTTVTFGNRLLLKSYRRLRSGAMPELEIGRFLTEVAKFPNSVPLAGTVDHIAADGAVTTLALLQAYVSNQGDGWTYTLNYLGRYFERRREGGPTPAADAHGAYLALVEVLAERTAELHRAFAAVTGDAAFDPEPAAESDYAAWKERVRADAGATFKLIESRLSQLPGPVQESAQALLAQAAQVLAAIEACPVPAAPALKTRHHGDFHLGQVLVRENDFVIIDFEGEPERPLDERRGKHSPLRDVAGMLRSFDYAQRTALKSASQVAEEYARLLPLAAEWQAEVRRTFLAAYSATPRGDEGHAAFEDAAGLLRLFEIEKALYELRYEINNRPEWAYVPLQGIRALIGEAGAV
ncbi:MAG TPA: maltose alpha-D-glucosyltransferase [Burkholderiales bacterium]|nr:maltose alpha-D-glucosyltransferase [Burkholderiales bacterium]